MKAIYPLLTILFLNIYSAASAQRITYSGKKVPLKTVFTVIQKQTGYGFFYDQKTLSAANPINASFKNATLTYVLTTIFKGQPLEYSIENKTIIVKKKSPAPKSLAVKPKPILSAEQTAKSNPTLPKKTASEISIENTDSVKTASILDSTNTLSKVADTKLSKITETAIAPEETGLKAQPSQAIPPSTATSPNTKFSASGGIKNIFSPIEIRKINFGFKGGMNSSRIYATELDGSKSGYIGTELYGGFFADTRMTGKLNMGTELIFSFTDSYHFIELPVHLKLNITEKLNLMAGPKLDYIADRMDEFDNFKRVGISGEIGSQYKINSVFFAEARYAYGFARQINSPGFGFYNGSRNTFRLGLGINFKRQEETGGVAKGLGPMRLRTGLNTGVALTSGYDVVVGADLRIQKNLGPASVGMLTAGYNHYSLKSGFIETNLAYFPIKAGIKLIQGNGFYLAPEAGIAIGTKSEVYTIPFVYAAGIGKQTKNGFDISLRYEQLTGRIVDYLDEIKRPAQLALRLEYGFNLNNDEKGSGSLSSPKNLPSATGTRKKTVFAEFGGNGKLTANFDTRLKADRNDGFGIRLGAGKVNEYLTLPLALNYIVGKRRSGFEVGLGFTAVYNTTDNGINIVGYGRPNESPKLQSMQLLTAGYRLQSYNGFMLRANTSIVHSYRYFSFVWPGLSVGYSFN